MAKQIYTIHIEKDDTRTSCSLSHACNSPKQLAQLTAAALAFSVTKIMDDIGIKEVDRKEAAKKIIEDIAKAAESHVQSIKDSGGHINRQTVIRSDILQ